VKDLYGGVCQAARTFLGRGAYVFSTCAPTVVKIDGSVLPMAIIKLTCEEVRGSFGESVGYYGDPFSCAD
jgi:hypothetical protein